MTLDDYIEKAKNELDAMKQHWIEENKKDPEGYKLDLEEDDWVEQELAYRFE